MSSRQGLRARRALQDWLGTSHLERREPRLRGRVVGLHRDEEAAVNLQRVAIHGA
jgi:hypothetical protein